MENNSEVIDKRKRDFKEFLRKIFKSVLKDDDIESILAPKPLEMFETAFTHRFISDRNYEVFEKIGDKILSSCFGMYLRRRFPNRNDPEFFNLVETFFCAKPKLKELSSKLGLPRYLINPYLSTTNRSDKEDLFESFIGATTVVCDEFITMHFGYGVAYELLAKIYDDEDIDQDNILKYKSYVGQLKEIYDVKNWGDVLYADNDKKKCPDQPYIVTIFNKDGIQLGRGESFIKKIAREDAAKKTMLKLGITMDDVVKLREDKMVDEETKPMINIVNKILTTARYKGLRHKKRNSSGKTEVYLQSQNYNGVWQLISSAIAGDERDAYIAALKEFIKMNP